MDNQKNYGIMKSVELSGDDAILAGITDPNKTFLENLKEYDKAVNRSIEIIQEKYRKNAGRYLNINP